MGLAPPGTELWTPDKKPQYSPHLRPTEYWGRNLAGLWLFNESGGNRVHDLSGNLNHGTIIGPTWGPGMDGTALDFDGNDYVDIADHVTLDAMPAITISAWINTGSQAEADEDTIVGKWDGSSPTAYLLRYDSLNNELDWFLAHGSIVATNSVSIEDNAWHHIVAFWDGNDMGVYLDGIKLPNGDVYSGSMGNISANLHIGSTPHTANDRFTGKIDNVLIYSRALSAAEVWQLYIGPYIIIEPEMIPLFAPVAAAGVPIPVFMHHYMRH